VVDVVGGGPAPRRRAGRPALVVVAAGWSSVRRAGCSCRDCSWAPARVLTQGGGCPSGGSERVFTLGGDRRLGAAVLGWTSRRGGCQDPVVVRGVARGVFCRGASRWFVHLVVVRYRADRSTRFAVEGSLPRWCCRPLLVAPRYRGDERWSRPRVGGLRFTPLVAPFPTVGTTVGRQQLSTTRGPSTTRVSTRLSPR
jgi:hypothetical protein